MGKYTYERVNIEDLKMLKNVINDDNEKLEKQIIDVLGELYRLDNEYCEYDEVINQNYKYFVNKFVNPISCLVVSGLGVFVANSLFSEDVPLSYELYCLLVGTICGSIPLQIFNKRENYVSSEDVVYTYNKCLSIEKSKERYIDEYYNLLRKYFGNRKDFVLEDELKKILDRHKAYINSQFEVQDDFNDWLSYNNEFFDDELVRARFDNLIKVEKQRKR